jgi:hypothetical protein
MLLLASSGYAESVELRAIVSAEISAPTGAACSRIFAKFDLPKTLGDAEVDYAEFRVPAKVTQTAGQNSVVRVLRVNRSWDPNSVTWLTPWQVPGGDLVWVPGAVTVVRAGTAERGPVPLVLDATDLVQYWADHPGENHGIAIASLDPGAAVSAKDGAPSPKSIVLKVYFTPRSR